MGVGVAVLDGVLDRDAVLVDEGVGVADAVLVDVPVLVPVDVRDAVEVVEGVDDTDFVEDVEGVGVAVAVRVHSIVHVVLDKTPPFKQEYMGTALYESVQYAPFTTPLLEHL